MGRAGSDLCRYAIDRALRSTAELPAADAQTLRSAIRRGAILIVESELPRPDRDAGSRILEQLMQALVRMGLRVYLLPANGDADAACIERLARLGVEVVPTPQSGADWRRLQTLTASLDFVWLCRPLVAVRFLQFFRRHSKAQVQYYPVDLHFLREARRYELTGHWLPGLRWRIYRWIEQSVIAAADAVLCLSHEEIAILATEIPRSKLRWVPPHSTRADTQRRSSVKASTAQPGLLFVGNFRHAPNEDAMRWFLQSIWPLVRSALAGAQLHIVGAAPPAWLRDEASSQIRIHDGVSDRKLSELYAASVAAIAPLRFGAGVKGKVLEAMEWGVPVVSTSIGLEGLPDPTSLSSPCDDAGSFAASIVHLATDPRFAADVAQQQRDYLIEHFSAAAVIDQLTLALCGEDTTATDNVRPFTPHNGRASEPRRQSAA
jgi:glycosyltransferase involved in cell wall biosynthesis